MDTMTARGKGWVATLSAIALLAALLPVLASSAPTGNAAGWDALMRNPAPLEDLSLVAIYSATDDDAQLLITAGSTLAERMKRVALRGPHGARVLSARFSDLRGLGLADLRLETPEPTLARLKKAYPRGNYRWSGRSVNGRRLRGVVKLSYKLLPAPVINTPTAGQSGLPTSGVTVAWQQVPGAAAIHVEVEDAELPRLLTVDLAGDATSLVLPDGFLMPNRPYVLDIKAVGPNGNLTVSDLEFHTG